VVFIHNGVFFNHEEELNIAIAGKWMVLENIILSEVSQVQKAKDHMFSLIYGIQT
jgi:hypothetical protein